MPTSDKPNVVYILTDQWRAKATGYNGDPNAVTPNIDRLAAESLDFTNAIGTSPVCTPARAALLTGRFPTSTGMFVNDANPHTRRESWSMTTATHQQDGHRCSLENGNHGTHKPAAVGMTLRSRCQTWSG